MADQTVVISDLLSFLACKVKQISREILMNTLKSYYSPKEISEAYEAFFTSLPEFMATKYKLSPKNLDSLTTLYNCFQVIPTGELPIFVCKNLNNIPELDTIKLEQINEEIDDDDDEEEEEDLESNDYGIEKTLREEQQTMKTQIADIALVVKQLKTQLDNISQQSQFKSKTNSQIKCKRKVNNPSNFQPTKKVTSETEFFTPKKDLPRFKKKSLKYLQSLIDEDEDERIDGDKSEKDVDSDYQLDSEFEEFIQKKKEEISCQVVLKEEPEDIDLIYNRIDVKKENEIYLASPSKGDQLENYFGDEGSPSKTTSQKVIYIKNMENRDIWEDDEENSIEIASSSDYLEEDPLSRVGLDSIITISKHSPSESIIIEKIEATNVEGYYYKCQRCEFICNEEKMILKHECNALTVDVQNRKPRRMNRYAGTNVFMCTICETYNVDVVEFNEHMLDHYKIVHGDGDYECVLCTLRTESYEDYRLHLIEHSWKIPYVCDLCDYRSTKEIRMRNHAVKHMECKGPNHFECLICRKICGTRNALEKHKQRHKKNYDFKCEICSLTFRHRSALSQHTMNHTKEHTFVCQVCNYRYDSQHSLNVHVKVHFKDDLFACHICDQKFKSKNTYRNHVLSMHSGMKPFKCDLCDEAFTFKHTMLMHRKTHGNQQYVCAYCNKKFKSPHYLKIHCAIHEGKNPFKCTSCDFNSSSKAILKKHMSEHVETLNVNNLMSCASGNYVTINPHEIDSHARIHNSDGYDESKMVIFMEPPQ